MLVEVLWLIRRLPTFGTWGATEGAIYKIRAYVLTPQARPSLQVLRLQRNRAALLILASMASPTRNDCNKTAECPFIVTIANPSGKKRHRPRDNEDATYKPNVKRQESPFKPWGKFERCGTMGISYQRGCYTRSGNLGVVRKQEVPKTLPGTDLILRLALIELIFHGIRDLVECLDMAPSSISH